MHWSPFVKHGEADNVRGQRIGSELDTSGIQTQRLGKCLGQRRLAHTGHILQQHVTLGQNGQQHLADDVLFAQNNFVDFRLNLFCQLVHAFLLFLTMMHIAPATITTAAPIPTQRMVLPAPTGACAVWVSGLAGTSGAVYAPSKCSTHGCPARTRYTATSARTDCSVAMPSPAPSSVWL